MLIQAEPLKYLVSTLLKKGGSCIEEAQVVADHLVRSNLAGHDSHGVGMLPLYVRMLKEDLLRPNQKPELVNTDGSILSLTVSVVMDRQSVKWPWYRRLKNAVNPDWF